MKIGVLQFPGSNCDLDVVQMLRFKSHTPQLIWHADFTDGAGLDALIIPGGFSYGDYLRAGALAARSRALLEVQKMAQKGVPILGICNGFQILAEAHLLPGVLLPNLSSRFQDQWVRLSLVHRAPFWGQDLPEVLSLPIAHGEGRYFLEPEALERVEGEGQVFMRYEEEVNGSVHRIAGVLNSQKNVLGLMPHPERAMQAWMGSADAWGFLP